MFQAIVGFSLRHRLLILGEIGQLRVVETEEVSHGVAILEDGQPAQLGGHQGAGLLPIALSISFSASMSIAGSE